ncbi:GNAT family N-acetyltransferase [Pelagibius marinus]|uniref:GNAT family N-acetyltransferase n=1 Tax=Pelagibius marinus TaxID=2762760 RepID=UPI0018733C7F|nr:GNAT family N-acetyltransferase [Pelagibius marinus]
MTATIPILTTERLILRPWRDGDLAPFAALNADPEVMEHFPAPLSRAESDAAVGRMRAALAAQGHGWWAAEAPGVAPFIGVIALAVPNFEAHFTPCVEVGWRLAKEFWGRGYATEGAREALRFGFEELGLGEVVSLTTTTNARSQAVMGRLGMTRDPADDFDHPKVPEGHPLRRHVLYRLKSAKWRKGQ